MTGPPNYCQNVGAANCENILIYNDYRRGEGQESKKAALNGQQPRKREPTQIHVDTLFSNVVLKKSLYTSFPPYPYHAFRKNIFRMWVRIQNVDFCQNGTLLTLCLCVPLPA